MRLLVTGGAGFIGSNFVHYWLDRHPGDRLVVLDALTYSGNPANLEPVRSRQPFRFVRGNICDTALVETLLRSEDIDTVVHFAAESHVDRSISGPDIFIETNVVGTHSLLKAARNVWQGKPGGERRRFHHISTDEVFGSLGPQDPPFTESTPYAPNSPYAASKAASDHLVRAYHRTYGMDVTISNCSNNYGRYHFPEKLIPLLIVNILCGKKLPIYGDGLNVRDWLHVSDHCRGIEAILQKGVSGETYNIGGRCESTNLDLVRSLCSVAREVLTENPDVLRRYPLCPLSRGAEATSLISFVADRPGHDRRYATDCSKIEASLGFRPAVTLEEGLRDTFRWYVQNSDWWGAILAGEHQGSHADSTALRA